MKEMEHLLKRFEIAVFCLLFTTILPCSAQIVSSSDLRVSLDESEIKQIIVEQNDGIVGIYEGVAGCKNKLACLKGDDEYVIVYMGAQKTYAPWRFGEIKATLIPSSTLGLFKANWYMADKTLNTDAFVIFDGGSMKVVIDGVENFYLKMYPTASSSGSSSKFGQWSGTGFALNSGYIVTNYHVVDGAKSIKVRGIKCDFNRDYEAEVVAIDRNNDLALIKITEGGFSGFGQIPYQVKTSMAEVGEEIFVLGYPLISTMGDEIKLTTGVISSRSGFQGDATLYQISAPVQPGNSGGPLFDSKGNLIGIVSAKHTGAENVGYVIKTSYLKNLIESSASLSILPNTNTVSNLSLSEKVKRLKKFTFTIICSNKEENVSVKYNGENNARNYNNDNVEKKEYELPYTYKGENSVGNYNNDNIEKKEYELPYTDNDVDNVLIHKVIMTEEYTAIEIRYVNKYYSEGWCNISRYAYIVANGKKYYMIHVENIKIAPEKHYFSKYNEILTFTLYFPAIPSYVTSIDLIESQDSPWKWYGIRLK